MRASCLHWLRRIVSALNELAPDEASWATGIYDEGTRRRLLELIDKQGGAAPKVRDVRKWTPPPVGQALLRPPC